MSASMNVRFDECPPHHKTFHSLKLMMTPVFYLLGDHSKPHSNFKIKPLLPQVRAL
jgi:hypothetical protein